ncbi:unnamed protein product [Anisakis simplex]|uniref:G_PROTEIN_RECEP_F1_2 domain-containing protein n=1 Tax=Anisakis simplex TaxID=6269 RepID=A0A0M3K320_ANISI|nr:unnamed protein product [Anisakis simplex]
MLTSEIGLLFPTLYVVEGFVIIAFNLSLLLFLLLERKFRHQKQYQILAGCVTFDFLFGCAYFSTGVYRYNLKFTNEYVPLVSRFYCLNKVHDLLILFITPEAGIISLFVALDRAVSVFYPIKYLKLPPHYPLVLFVTSFSAIIPAYVTSYMAVIPSRYERNQSGMCFLKDTLPDNCYAILRWIRIVTSILAIAVYIPIACKIRKVRL